MKKISVANMLFACVICFLAFLLMMKPEICKQGVSSAIILCGQVLIPSLFPFSVCVLFIMKSGVLEKISFISAFTEKIFGLSAQLFSIMVLSALGGYPIGAKLIDQAVQKGVISPSQGGQMLNYCVNAGPAFIIAAVGSGILGLKPAGYILLAAHISASVVICIFSRIRYGKIYSRDCSSDSKISCADNFVESACEASSITTNICGFVILFSAVTAYIEYFSDRFDFMRRLLFITEVTTAVTRTRNIYLISFLLGFSCVCIWCQILSVGRHIDINIPKFIAFRILHGIISAVFTAGLIKIFRISLPTFSSGQDFSSAPSVSGIQLSAALLIMGIVFIISLMSRSRDKKILEEFV